MKRHEKRVIDVCASTARQRTGEVFTETFTETFTDIYTETERSRRNTRQTTRNSNRDKVLYRCQ